MINLLPLDVKNDYQFARRNVTLRKWIIGISASIVGVAIIVASGMFYLNQSIQAYSRQKAETTQQLKTEKLEETQKKLQDISSNLKLVTQVLGQEVLFSKIMQQIGSVMPADAVLTDLNIGVTSGGIDVKAATTNQAVATQVQVNLQDPKNKIFDKVDIINITCSSTAYGGKYPCAVQLRASFNKCNQFLFVSPACATAGSTKV